MSYLKEMLPRLREQAQAAIATKRIPPPTSMEVEEAGEFLTAYREFWKRIEKGGNGTPNDIMSAWWQETFGQLRPITYLGFSLVNDSICIAAQHQGAQTAFFVIFASGITDIMWSDQIENFLKSIEMGTYEGPDSEIQS